MQGKVGMTMASMSRYVLCTMPSLTAHVCWQQEQIPLVQRQWDIVSQFRSQITHKATLSLRESGASSGVSRISLVLAIPC